MLNRYKYPRHESNKISFIYGGDHQKTRVNQNLLLVQ